MRIIFTVSNDLSYDQRMHRICHSLASNHFDVMLVGRTRPHSIPLTTKAFRQKRLSCISQKGFLFYAEYNVRLFLFLLFQKKYDAICSIDLDTLPAGFLASILRQKKRVFDAHEYFSEVPEVVNRPMVKSFWEMIARRILPHYKHAYTVGKHLAAIFEQAYQVPFQVVRNAAVLSEHKPDNHTSSQKILLYQGALNEGRGLEATIEAMQYLDGITLVLVGEGDLSTKLRALTDDLQLGDKVVFKGFMEPIQLKVVTQQAWLGINLLENRGLSYYYSLANKFFDYVQAGVPILTMDFPEYKALNQEHEVAYLLSEPKPELIAIAIRNMLFEPNYYEKLQQNCLVARNFWNWSQEEITLLRIWSSI
jgi:glycosyltransferase involved in cell wall biosynthesis